MNLKSNLFFYIFRVLQNLENEFASLKEEMVSFVLRKNVTISIYAVFLYRAY